MARTWLSIRVDLVDGMHAPDLWPRPGRLMLARPGMTFRRRALGATRQHVSRQFLGEAVLLSGIGGVGGGLLGLGVVAAYAGSRDLPVSVDAWVPIAGVAAAVVIGAVAGVYPAIRAARMSPTEALNH